jgi:lipopolysaccharide/colanic/teichoic acid biosynthesis glycosyltransferase
MDGMDNRIPRQAEKLRLSDWKKWVKRGIDVVVATVGLLFSGPLILIALGIAAAETGQVGLFRQVRVGRHGRLFHVLKIRTMRSTTELTTTTTTLHDPRITPWGRFFRRTKIDELPQLWNVVRGDMSLVGPRPDVPELVNTLPHELRELLLSVRPGITGPATLLYRHEEQLLAGQPDPERFNREVLFPQKTAINCAHIRNYRLRSDIVCLVQTLLPTRRRPTTASPHPVDDIRRAA